MTPVDIERYSFEYDGKILGPVTYGQDFLPELRRIVLAYTPTTPKLLEWGAGVSTLLLSEFAASSAGSLVSIEHNATYANSVLSRVRHPATLRLFAEGLEGPRFCQDDVGLNYSTLPLSLGTSFDFVMIDGRRRLECAYSAFVLSTEHTVVVLHDYRRTRYQSVKVLFDVIEDGAQFRVMRPKPTLLSATNNERARLIAEHTGTSSSTFPSRH